MSNHPENPEQTRERLTAALQDVLDSKEEFHIENAPDGSGGYMQCVPGKPGCLYIEYSTCPSNGTRRMFRCTDDVLFEDAIELFFSYTSRQQYWEKQIVWEEWTDEFHASPGPLATLKMIGAVFLVVILISGFIWGFIDDWKDSLLSLIWIPAIALFALISYICSRFWKNKFFWPN